MNSQLRELFKKIDERWAALHDLVHSARESVRLEISDENRPNGLFENLQAAFHVIGGRISFADMVKTGEAAAIEFSIAKLQLSENDILVVKVDEILSQGQVHEIQKCFRPVIPEAVQIVVLGKGASLSVIKKVENEINE